ncbi:hypothetical protein [Saccharothrix sp. HUAS TT1]|uniref:hypothetical protein n=1 Tax=unclassified Saccharothrix TaxID=2593673 RepID=UPI00345BEBCD
MTSSQGLPPWLQAMLDQEHAGHRELRTKTRAEFERMVRRATGDERVVAERMAWFDAQQSHLDAWLGTALGDPAAARAPQPATATPPGGFPGDRLLGDPFAGDQPTRRDHPRAGGVDPEPERRRPDPVMPEFPAGQAPWADLVDRPAPGRATRLTSAPAVLAKALGIGLLIGGGVWLAATLLLMWLTDSPLWGWWPSLVTVTVGALAALWWFNHAFTEIGQWLRNGGTRPLTRRHPFA